MDELALKLAELLDISVEQAVKLYPFLRGQMKVYRMANIVDNIAIFIALIVIVFLAIYILGDFYETKSDLNYNKKYDLGIDVEPLEGKFVNNLDYDVRMQIKYNNSLQEYEKAKKVINILIGILVGAFIVSVITEVIKALFATDLLLIMKLIG